MHSSEGEYIPFPTPVIVDGPVEVWLTSNFLLLLCKIQLLTSFIGVETAMVATLRRELMHSLTTFKKSKKEKWVKDTPGQMLITGSQVLQILVIYC